MLLRPKISTVANDRDRFYAKCPWRTIEWGPFHWDGESFHFPWRRAGIIEERYRAPRLMIDLRCWIWPDEFPRRLYWFGRRLSWTMALGRNATTQKWSWSNNRFTYECSWLTFFPSDYRERAKADP